MFFRLGRLIRILGRDLLLLWYACRNPLTPPLLKLGAVLLALYTLSPLDVIPDWLPVLGWLDDVTLIAFAVPALLKFVPQQAMRDAHLAADGWLSRSRFWFKS